MGREGFFFAVRWRGRGFFFLLRFIGYFFSFFTIHGGRKFFVFYGSLGGKAFFFMIHGGGESFFFAAQCRRDSKPRPSKSRREVYLPHRQLPALAPDALCISISRLSASLRYLSARAAAGRGAVLPITAAPVL